MSDSRPADLPNLQALEQAVLFRDVPALGERERVTTPPGYIGSTTRRLAHGQEGPVLWNVDTGTV